MSRAGRKRRQTHRINSAESLEARPTYRHQEDLIRESAANRVAGDLKWRRDRQSAPRVRETPKEPISRRTVQDRVMRAMQTVRVLPDRERKYFAVNNGWPEMAQEFDAYNSVEARSPRFTPSPEDISQYLRSLSWTRHLPKSDWKILWLRSFGFSYRLIGEYIGRSDETARRRFDGIITDVWCTANNIAR